MDDGGGVTLLLHKGKEYEQKWAKDGSRSDPASATSSEFKCILQSLKDSFPLDQTNYSRRALKCKGVGQETTTGLHRRRERTATDELLSRPSTWTTA